MSGGEISGNTANNGGGVSGDITMSGGKISGNTANNGGGVSGTLTMNGGEISSNTSSLGGGVYVNGNHTITMNGGEISYNTASTNGGGVYVDGDNTTFTMNGGEISYNTASTSGGGVYVYRGTTFTMNGGEISGNTAPTSGGGVYLEGTFRISTGIIYGSGEGTNSNTATNGAALYRASGTAQYGTFSITWINSTVYYSTWNSNGVLNTTNNTIRVVEGVLQQ
jgi:predicted outer membrane repeat protein